MRSTIQRMLHLRWLRRAGLAGAVAAAMIGAALSSGANAASTGAAAPATTNAAAANSVAAGAENAIAQLAASGELTRAQAGAIEAQLNAGSVDPKQLVAEGVVSDAQMRVAAHAIDQVKRNNG